MSTTRPGLFDGPDARAARGAPADAMPPEFETEPVRAVESRLFRWLVAVAIVGVSLMWTWEWQAGTLKLWNGRWLYPILVCMLVLSWLLLGRSHRLDLAGRMLVTLAVNVQILGSSHAALFLDRQALDAQLYATDLFWLPMSWTVAFAALPAHVARPVVVASMAGFSLPVLWALVAGPPAHWPPSVSTWLTNVVIAQILYVPLLTGIARIRDRASALDRRAAAMQTLAMRDHVTGLPNRRFGHWALKAMLDDERQRPAVVMLLDIDHFKRVNDEHGHAVGDRVLAAVALAVAHTLRTSDLVARWGGEEFLVLAQGIDRDAALELAERVRRAASGAEGASPRVTVSIGLTMVAPGDDADAVLSRADAALYEAKDGGRDVVREKVAAA